MDTAHICCLQGRIPASQEGALAFPTQHLADLTYQNVLQLLSVSDFANAPQNHLYLLSTFCQHPSRCHEKLKACHWNSDANILLVIQLINRGATVNHMALSRSGSSADGTTPLHACAAMRPSRYTTKDGFYETARVLMLAGGNPYQENLAGMSRSYEYPRRRGGHVLAQCKQRDTDLVDDLQALTSQALVTGLTPIDVAANRSNTHMKVLLEGCALFKGILILPIAKLFGGRPAER